MVFDASAFSFGTYLEDNDAEFTFVAKIPGFISSRQELFVALGAALRLPAYFGDNWDALSECLADLTWITERRVVIRHSDLPRLQASDIVVYLTILYRSIQGWRAWEDHQLIVEFPGEARETIQRLASTESPSA
jgi:hypothetical protein